MQLKKRLALAGRFFVYAAECGKIGLGLCILAPYILQILPG
jgi:hypothetical protein